MCLENQARIKVPFDKKQKVSGYNESEFDTPLNNPHANCY